MLLAAGTVVDDEVPDEDLVDIVVLRQDATDHRVGLVDEDDLHRAEVPGRTAGLVHLNTGSLMEFLKKRK